MIDFHEMTIVLLVVINTIELFFLFSSWKRVNELEKIINLIEMQQKLDFHRQSRVSAEDR